MSCARAVNNHLTFNDLICRLFFMNNTPTKLVAAKYRASSVGNSKFGVYMFCFDDETGKFDTSGSLISRTAMTYDKAVASAAKWQAKEDKGVASDNKRNGFT